MSYMILIYKLSNYSRGLVTSWLKFLYIENAFKHNEAKLTPTSSTLGDKKLYDQRKFNTFKFE